MKPADNSHYSISAMSQQGLQTVLNWAAIEGWNPGINDASAFYAADPAGFWLGNYEGQPVASISAVKYGRSFGFIGLYIVNEAFRGKGFGYKIWEAAIASLAGRNIGLDGVLAQQENYRKSGFKHAFRNIRFAGKSTQDHTPSTNIRNATELNFSQLESYDRQFFPEERTAFLKSWINPANTHTLALVENSTVVAYGSIRACERGFRIGPLNAENTGLAVELFLALTATVPEGSEIFLDVPEPNRAALQLAETFGMNPVFETARMYTKELPQIPLEKIFGITSLELG